MNNHIRVRFAPSPTGYLHIGGLRTAYFNWLFARHNKGLFLVRIEDTDTERSEQRFTQAILDTLAWVNVQPDEPIVVQSARKKEHQLLIQKLLNEGKAYRCYCTQEELVARYGNQAFIRYDGLCKTKAEVDVHKPYAVRFKIPDDCTQITFEDLIRGTVTFERDQLDDFIIQRSDGNPIYNFVVVADDHTMGITQVIRGEDHISNTPKQILLYQALNFFVPSFAHLPLILGPSGDRLSKRDAATDVRDYKAQGYLPDALLNYLVRLGWAHGDQEIFSQQELIDLFTLGAIGKKGAIFDPEKLKWVNGMYIREASNQYLYDYLTNELQPNFAVELGQSQDFILKAIELYKERVSTLRELIDVLTLFCKGPTAYNPKALDQWTDEKTESYLDQLITLLEKEKIFKADHLSAAIKLLSKQLEVKLVHLAQPVRIALIGDADGPGAFALLALLDKEESISRLQRLRNALPKVQD